MSTTTAKITTRTEQETTMNGFRSFEIRAHRDGFGIFAPGETVPFRYFCRCHWHKDANAVRREAADELRRLQS